MKVNVVDMTGKKVKTATLPSEIFEAPIKKDLMHQAFVRQMANARLGTRKTKTRGLRFLPQCPMRPSGEAVG